MAIDRGGLEYTISVRDQFSKATARFRTEIDAARDAFVAFKRETESLATANSRITVTLNQASAASARKTRQLSAEEEAERKLTRILRDRIVQERVRELAQEKGVTLSKKKIRQLSVEQEAERRLQRQARAAAVARKTEELAQERSIDLTRRKVRVLSVEEEAQKKVAVALRRRAVAERAAQIAEEKGIELGKKRARELSIEEEALRKVERAERARAVAARVAQIEQQKFVGPKIPDGFVLGQDGKGFVPPPADKETLKGLSLARERLTRFRDTLGQTNAGGNDLLFTFRRLFGVLAAFQAARAIFNGFIDLIRAGVEFNSTIERTRLGIASVIVAVGQVRDAQGELLDSGEAFLAAQKEATRQQRLLRAESLKTTATFEELLDAFQTAVGPGVASGLNLDQIREFSIRISQAASAIGVAQNQLSEEIRSILSGTIQQRTTRIAAVLQISNEDIRNAREAGRLFEFLQERFQTFGIAGEEAGKTFEGLTAIFKGAISELAGLAAQPLFEELKSTLSDLISLILTIGPDGAILINPETVEAVAPIFQGILVALEAIKASARQIGFDDISSSAKAIGVAIALAGVIIGGVIEGIINGFTVVVAVIDGIVGLFDEQELSLQELIALVTEYTVIFGSAVAAAGLLGFALSALISPFKQLLSLAFLLSDAVLKSYDLFKKIPLDIRKSLGGAAALAAIFLTIGTLLREAVSAIFGVNVSLKNTIELLSLGFVGGILDAISFVQELGLTIKNSISEAFISAGQSASKFINEAKVLLASFTGNDKKAEALVAQQDQADLAADRERFLRRRRFEVELADLRAQNEAKSLGFTKEIATVVGDAAGEDALGRIPTLFQEILGGLSGLLDGFGDEADKLEGDNKFSLDSILDLEGFSARLRAALEAAKASASGVTVAPRGVPIEDDARKALLDAQQKLALTEQQVESQRELNDLTAVQASEARIRLQQLRNESAELQAQIETERALNQFELDRAQRAINGAQGDEQRLFLSEQLEVLKQQQLADESLLVERLRSTNIELERQRQIVSGTINEGFSQGLQDFANQFGSAFQAGVNIATGIVQSFASFVSQTIVDAFDPTNDTSLTERIGQFLQGISQLILDEFIKLQLANLLQSETATASELAAANATLAAGVSLTTGASAIAAATPGLTAAAAALAAAAQLLITANIVSGGGVGLAKGGKVVGLAEGGGVPGRGRASAAHYGFGVKGLKRGGAATPPPGVDRRDTVPIWAQPGEFMQSLAAARAYGYDVMQAINSRMVDPGALRALAGLSHNRRLVSAARKGPGFASGGLISDQITKQTAAQSFAATQGSQGGGMVRAVVVPDEAAFDRLQAGGSQAQFNFFRENRDTLNSILGGR